MIRRFFRLLRGRWRLFWGACPACRSDAPGMYSCRVCEWWEPRHRNLNQSGVPPEQWWQRFKEMTHG